MSMDTIRTQSDVFETGCEMIDVSSNHRPDTSWKFTDPAGHLHQWYADGKPATDYRPWAKHDVPTLVWVKDGVGHYEDGEEYEIGHHECRECGAPVEPRYTADMCQQMMPGRRWFRINGVPVSPEVFAERVAAAKAAAPKRAVTFDRLLRMREPAPLRCADGAFGLIIRYYRDIQAIGVQVPGEEHIREISVSRLVEDGDGAFSEIAHG